MQEPMAHKKARDIFQMITDDRSNKELPDFDIGSLTIYTEEELEDKSLRSANFFATNDFLVAPKDALDNAGYSYDKERKNDQEIRRYAIRARGNVGVKMGSLYIEYGMGGKGSLKLTISHLDFATKEVRQLFDFSQGRYGVVKLTDIAPFYPLYSATYAGGGITDSKALEAAAEIKQLITQMALGKTVGQEQFKQAVNKFLIAVNPPAKGKEEVETATLKEEVKTENLKEVAEELAQIYYKELGIEKEEIQAVLIKYRSKTGNDIDMHFIEKLGNTYVDQNRYMLKGLWPFTEKDFEEIIEKVNASKLEKQQKPKAKVAETSIPKNTSFGQTSLERDWDEVQKFRVLDIFKETDKSEKYNAKFLSSLSKKIDKIEKRWPNNSITKRKVSILRSFESLLQNNSTVNPREVIKMWLLSSSENPFITLQEHRRTGVLSFFNPKYTDSTQIILNYAKGFFGKDNLPKELQNALDDSFKMLSQESKAPLPGKKL